MSISDTELNRFYGEYERPSYRKVIGYCKDCEDEIYDGDKYYVDDGNKFCNSCVDDDFLKEVFDDKFDIHEKIDILGLERVNG